MVWERGPAGLPLAAWEDGELVERWAWSGLTRLAAWQDVRREVGMRFHYRDKEHAPYAMTVATPAGEEVLALGCDQTGTVKIVADLHGHLVKEVLYDSFGNVVRDWSPRLYLPLGFAGGAVCRWTGFVCLGFRDYDPATGRFTAQDPLGDTGGDHDPYEYCVDDPVNAVDVTGLDGEIVKTLKKAGGFIKKMFGLAEATKEGFDAVGSNATVRDKAVKDAVMPSGGEHVDEAVLIDRMRQGQNDTYDAILKSSSKIGKEGIEILQKTVPGR